MVLQNSFILNLLTQEPRILMREAIVILPPYSGCEEDVERRNLLSPFDLEALLDPLAMLVDHRINDVNERFVAVEQTMSTRQNIALKPALEEVSYT
jgi:hypothetical protein